MFLLQTSDYHLLKNEISYFSMKVISLYTYMTPVIVLVEEGHNKEIRISWERQSKEIIFRLQICDKF